MTVSVELANMPTSGTDVSVKLMTYASLKKRKTLISGNQQTTEYIYSVGDVGTPTTVSVLVEANPKTNTVRHSIQLTTVQTVTTDSVVTEVEPVTATLSWVTPGVYEDSAKISDMLGTLFGLTFKSLTTKVPNTGVLDDLNRSITESLYG